MFSLFITLKLDQEIRAGSPQYPLGDSTVRILNAALSVLLLIAFAATAVGEEAAEETEAGSSPHQFSANVLIATEYLYRGISQSNEDPALQGGFDYTYEPWGFYMGFWASSIEFNARTANTSSIETNFYGGFAGEFPIGVSWNIGGLYYYYPDTDEDLGADYNFVELYGNLGYTFEAALDPTVDVGFAWSPDFYGEDDDGLYLHGKLSVSLPYNFGLSTMFGYQDVDGDLTSGPAGFDYSHWNVGLSYDYSILSFEVSWNDGSDDCGPSDICEAWLFTVSSSW